jgi:hypothetical protein
MQSVSITIDVVIRAGPEFHNELGS